MSNDAVPGVFPLERCEDCWVRQVIDIPRSGEVKDRDAATAGVDLQLCMRNSPLQPKKVATSAA